MSNDKLQFIEPIVTLVIDGVKYESISIDLVTQNKIEQETGKGYYELLGRTASCNIPCGGFLINEIRSIFKVAFPDINDDQFKEFFIKDRLSVYGAVFDVICLPFQAIKVDESDEPKKKTT